MSDRSTPGSRESTEHNGLGLPASGPGSAAGLGRRLAALVIDCALSALVATVFTRPEPPKLWSAVVLFVAYTFFVGVFGQTPGMRLLGIGVVRVIDSKPIGIPRAALRALLLQLVLPAAVMDSNGRGWHDRAAGSVVVRG
jgi:uncharacterized RDD family membrane protein YckC